MGGGGHADAAAGAKLAIVTTRLNAAGHAKIVDRLTSMTTPGETVDVVVTDEGVAVNPLRIDLRDKLQTKGIDVEGSTPIALREPCPSMRSGRPQRSPPTDSAACDKR